MAKELNEPSLVNDATLVSIVIDLQSCSDFSPTFVLPQLKSLVSFQLDDSTFDETVTLYNSELNVVLSIKDNNRISTECIPETQKIQVVLPIQLGGIGIRSLMDLSLPAFLSSCFGVMPLVSTILQIPVDSLALNSLQEGIETWETQKCLESPSNKTSQYEWDKLLLNRKIENKLKFNDPRDCARRKAIQNNEAGAWLHAFLSQNIGMFMDNISFQICVGLRLGCNLCHGFQCKCGETVDKKGLHPLSCSKNSGKCYRHAEINNIIKKALVSVDIPAQLEPIGLNRNDGKRPDGATLIPWTKGMCLVWDFTCSDTFANSHINLTKENPGAAAELAVQRKHNKYSSLKSRGFILVVPGVETMGVWCEEGKKWVQSIGDKLITKTGNPKSKTYLKQRISMAIQRGNAASILSSFPAAEELESVFSL